MIGVRPSAAKIEQRVNNLLQKTVERNATVGEEVAAVQLAYKLARDHSLDLDWFRIRLAAIGKPPRYLVTADGFLVPTQLIHSAAPRRPDGAGGRSNEDEVTLLLRRTRENGATPREETLSVQRAYALLRHHELDAAFFRMRLGPIGDPPRYMLTDDGFVVPTALLRPSEPHGESNRRQRASSHDDAEAQAGGRRDDTQGHCPLSPTGKHRMDRYFRGTLATGAVYCVHCGLRA